MRIGIEVQRLFRPNKHGMEIVALELIKQLQKIDHQNEYIIFVKDDEDDQCIRETGNFRIEKVKGRSYVDWEDLLHCTCNTAPLFIDIPLFLTLHDIIFLESTSFKGSAYQNIGNIYRKLIVPSIIKKSNLLITVSDFERENIINRLKVDNEKIVTVYNAANESFRKIDDENYLSLIRKKYQLPQEFILFFGNKAPKKNTVNVLKGYSEYISMAKEKKLPLIITDCSTTYINRIIDHCRIQEIKDHLEIRNYIPFDELPAVYNLATLYLYPSVRESFGMPILESMACGTPVITSNTSSMPEVAKDGAVLVDPFNFKQLGKKISETLNDLNLQKTLIEKGYQRVKRFSWKITAEAVLQLYEKAGNRNGKSYT